MNVTDLGQLKCCKNDDCCQREVRMKASVGLLSLDDLATKMSSDRLLGSVLRQVTAVAA
jgi:hypothetical protein